MCSWFNLMKFPHVSSFPIELASKFTVIHFPILFLCFSHLFPWFPMDFPWFSQGFLGPKTRAAQPPRGSAPCAPRGAAPWWNPNALESWRRKNRWKMRGMFVGYYIYMYVCVCFWLFMCICISIIINIYVWLSMYNIYIYYSTPKCWCPRREKSSGWLPASVQLPTAQVEASG